MEILLGNFDVILQAKVKMKKYLKKECYLEH